MALSTNSDVIKYSRIEKEFPTCNVEDIEEIEWKEFKDILGLDFYEALETDKIDFSTFDLWSDKTAYVVGDKVQGINENAGKYYIAIADNSEVVTNTDFWKPYNIKFNTDCFDSLWCKGSLARYLALSVIVQTIVTSATKLTTAGVIEKFGDGYRSSSTSRVKMLEAHYMERRKVALEKLTAYILKDETECYDLSLIKTNPMSCGCIKNCGCSSKSSTGWLIPDYETPMSQSFGTNGPIVYTEKPKAIYPYETLEEGYAQKEKFFYLSKMNDEGALENSLQFNPSGTIHNL